jgi:hypothetical protein
MVITPDEQNMLFVLTTRTGRIWFNYFSEKRIFFQGFLGL